MIYVKLLGGFGIVSDDLPIALPKGVRSRCILARLILSRDEELQRSYLAGLIWPDSSEHQARTNLRREIHQLRTHSPFLKESIQTSRAWVRWLTPSAIELDVEKFSTQCNIFHESTSDDEKLISGLRALGTYTGDLLATYEDRWIVEQRQRLAHAWIQLAEEVLTLQNRRGHFAESVSLANTLIAKEPLRESLYVELMQAHECLGNPALAMQTYHQCVSVLGRELGVGPNADLHSRYTNLIKPNLAEAQTPDALPIAVTMTNKALIGRRQELTTILRTMEVPCHVPKLIRLIGEAGIGKTRLAEEAIARALAEGYSVAHASCHAAAGDLALSVIHRWLESPVFKNTFKELDPWWKAILQQAIPPFVFNQSFATTSANPPASQPDRPTQFEALSRLLSAPVHSTSASANYPRLLFVDDLQWADADSLAFISYLLNRSNEMSIILLATQRSEGHAYELPLHTLIRQLDLSNQLINVPIQPFPSADARSLARQILNIDIQEQADTRLLQNIENICRWSQGNPFYLTETLLHLASTGNSKLSETQTTIPVAPRIATIVEERLFSLDVPSRNLLLFAAVVGRRFSVPLLAELTSSNRSPLAYLLDPLWRNNFISDVGSGDYNFSHDCIREICYALLSVPQRQEMHARVAETLESLHKDNLEAIAGQIAFHWLQAKADSKAFTWFEMAIEQAEKKLHSHEVIQCVEACLSIMDRQSGSEYSLSQRVVLLQVKSHMLSLIDGFGGDRERVICQELEHHNIVLSDESLVFTSLTRIRIHASFDGRISHAKLCVDRQMTIARTLDDPWLIMEAYRSRVFVHYQQGNYSEMLQSSSEGIAIVDQLENSGDISYKQPLWSALMLRAMSVFALQMGGQSDAADEALKHCKNYRHCVGNDHVLGLVHFWMILTYSIRSDWNQVFSVSQQLREIGSRSALIKLESMGLCGCANVEIHRGNLALASEQLHNGIELMESAGEYQPVIDWYLDMASLCLRQKQLREANSWLLRSEEAAQRFGVQTFTSRRLRLQAGYLSHLSAGSDKVLDFFHKSYDLAKQQGAVKYQFDALESELRYRRTMGIPEKENLHNLQTLISIFKSSGPMPELVRAEKIILSNSKGKAEKSGTNAN